MRRNLLVVALLALPITAAAQTPRTGPGPLVVERLENHFVVAMTSSSSSRSSRS